MSIWISVDGENPVTYDAMDGMQIDPNGWIDVAVSCLGGERVRLIVEDSGGEGRVSLDLAGLDELERRIKQAREQLLKVNTWER